MSTSTKSTETFIAEGKQWFQDRYETIKVERNRYFFLLLITLAALIISIIANLSLSPLKTAVPYVIEVDKSTGITSVLKPVNTSTMREDEAVTVYFLYKYINARMTYDWDLRQNNADIVRALSAAQSYQLYAQQMDINNPDSPIKKYSDHQKVVVHITSHAFPYPNIAEIHFYTDVIDPILAPGSNTASNRQYWVATIKYTYANNAISLADRENINPLGFFVTSFQLNSEIPGGVS